MDDKDIILITVSGHRNSGKSSVLFFLNAFFKMLGFKVNIDYRDTIFKEYEKKMYKKEGKRLIHNFRNYMRHKRKVIFLREEDNDKLHARRSILEENRGREKYDLIENTHPIDYYNFKNTKTY